VIIELATLIIAALEWFVERTYPRASDECCGRRARNVCSIWLVASNAYCSSMFAGGF